MEEIEILRKTISENKQEMEKIKEEKGRLE